MDPVVSVCIPSRDRAPLLGEALRSALGQDGPALEVVVCDDGSTDATPEVLAAAMAGDVRVRAARNDAPLGVARSRDRCLAAARGRYVAWLDSDDAYLPGALARQVAVLDAHPAASLAHGGFHVVGATGERQRDWAAPFARDTVEPGAEAFLHLLATNEITTSTVVARRAAHADAGPFGGSRPGASSSDWATWLRLALRGDVAYTAAPVASYRQHPATISHAAAPGGERLRCDVAVVRELLRAERRRVPDPRRAGAVARSALAAKALLHAGDLFTRGDRAAALRAIGLAVRLVPASLSSPGIWLARSTALGDAYGCYRATKVMLGRLAEPLEGTRFGLRVAAAAERDLDWEATLVRAAGVVRRVVPADACVGAVAKWDPTLLAFSHRRGRNFPDRRTLPDGYPADSEVAVEHLEAQRRAGLSHLVLPSASFWWLEHYAGLAAHLERRHRRLWQDQDCVIFDLRGGAGAAR